MLADPATQWKRLAVPAWYGQGERVIEVHSDAVWRHGGMPVVPLRWVLLRDPLGHSDPQALLCTDPACEALRGSSASAAPEIVAWFVQRWQLEAT